MGKIRTTLAAMLSVLALTAFQSDAYAQAQRSSRSTTSSRSTSSSNSTRTSTQRSSGSSVSRSSSSNNRSSAVRPSTGTTRQPSTATRPSTGTTRQPSTATRPSTGTTRQPVTRPNTPNAKPGDRPAPGKPDRPLQIRPDHRPDPHRLHPRDRQFMSYHKPSHYWSHHNHCFGYRVRVLPAHVVRHYHHGHVYYCYNDIWYRPYGGYYVVCRPPFGTVLAANLIADMAWVSVRYSYYNTIANTYSKINENNQYIAEQNALIAQNNATIAAQNQTIAMNQQLASQSYTLANELGLIQSYAAANTDYFYQDGVFYVMDAAGQYKTIAPPAGALVETLPEDYDMITLKGNEYYKVDETVYKVTISEGQPYFEVLGQLYS